MYEIRVYSRKLKMQTKVEFKTVMLRRRNYVARCRRKNLYKCKIQTCCPMRCFRPLLCAAHYLLSVLSSMMVLGAESVTVCGVLPSSVKFKRVGTRQRRRNLHSNVRNRSKRWCAKHSRELHNYSTFILNQVHYVYVWSGRHSSAEVRRCRTCSSAIGRCGHPQHVMVQGANQI